MTCITARSFYKSVNLNVWFESKNGGTAVRAYQAKYAVPVPVDVSTGSPGVGPNIAP